MQMLPNIICQSAKGATPAEVQVFKGRQKHVVWIKIKVRILKTSPLKLCVLLPRLPEKEKRRRPLCFKNKSLLLFKSSACAFVMLTQTEALVHSCSHSATFGGTLTCSWEALHTLFCFHSPWLLAGTLNSNSSQELARLGTVAASPQPLYLSQLKGAGCTGTTWWPQQ